MMWRQVPSYPLYEASADGRIREIATGRLCKLAVRWNGYVRACVKPAIGARHHLRIASRLTREAFHGLAPTPEHEAAHRNGVRSDNRCDNLRWATPKENNVEKIDHGTQPQGRRHWYAKLTEVQVREIRRRAKTEKQKHLATEFGIGTGHVCLIVNRKLWSHVND